MSRTILLVVGPIGIITHAGIAHVLASVRHFRCISLAQTVGNFAVMFLLLDHLQDKAEGDRWSAGMYAVVLAPRVREEWNAWSIM